MTSAVPPRAIGRLVRAARRRWGVMRALESLLFGLAAGALTLAAGAFSGAAVGAPGALGAAAISGALAAVTWFLERARSAREIARRIDGGLARDGAFVTAFEREAEASGPIERALVERVAREVGPPDVRRTVRPPSVALLAVPLVAAAALVLALELGGRRAERAGSLWRALAVELGSAAPGDQATDEELAALAEVVRDLAQRPPQGDELARALERVETELSELADEGDAELERALDLIDRARSELGATDAGSRDRPAEVGAGGLAESTPSDTMTGSPTPAEGSGGGTLSAPEVAAAVPAPSPEAGVLAGRWWDERYDAIVTGWRVAREERENP